MTELSIILGTLLKAFFELEMAAILIKSIMSVFLKRDSTVCRILSYAAEPAVFPIRIAVSKSSFLSRFPIDVTACMAFVVLALADILFGMWF